MTKLLKIGIHSLVLIINKKTLNRFVNKFEDESGLTESSVKRYITRGIKPLVIIILRERVIVLLQELVCINIIYTLKGGMNKNKI